MNLKLSITIAIEVSYLKRVSVRCSYKSEAKAELAPDRELSAPISDIAGLHYRRSKAFVCLEDYLEVLLIPEVEKTQNPARREIKGPTNRFNQRSLLKSCTGQLCANAIIRSLASGLIALGWPTALKSGRSL
jgi:hypothetical protein